MTAADRTHLVRAIELAEANVAGGQGGPFGAVIVREGRVIAEGVNEVTTINDPTAHAEIVAIRRACRALGSFSLQGSVIYASCEPCPMCLAAIHWARIDRLVFAATRFEAAAIGFDDALIYEEIGKPLDARLLPSVHMPLPEAEAAFKAWMEKADRVSY